MEIGAQLTPDSSSLAAVVCSIPSDGLIKQFGVDIGEGDEIVSVNGRTLRNRSEVEIDRIIGESAMESQGELELLVQQHHGGNGYNTTQRGGTLPVEEDLTTTTTEETTSSSDLQHEDLIGSDSNLDWGVGLRLLGLERAINFINKIEIKKTIQIDLNLLVQFIV